MSPLDRLAFNNMKKIFFKEIDSKKVAIIFFVVMVAAMLPIIWLAQYDHAAADDYTYGYDVHMLIKNGVYNPFIILKTVFERIKITYFTWSGNFASTFFWALTPVAFSPKIYFISPLIILSVMFASIFFFVRALGVKILKADKTNTFVWYLLLMFVIVESWISPGQGWYWYNGGMPYTFMHGLFITMLGIMLSYLVAPRTIHLVILSVLGFVVGGSNMTTSLTAVLAFSLLLMIECVLKRKSDVLKLIAPFIILAAAFAANILAPGNAVRQALFVRNTPVKAIWDSLILSFHYTVNYTSLLIVAAAILSIPVCMKLIDRVKFSFGFPGLVSVFTFLIIAEMACPYLYSSSDTVIPISRLENIIKETWVILLFINVLYWCGWVKNKAGANKYVGMIYSVIKRMRINVATLLIFAVIVVADTCMAEVPVRANKTYAAIVATKDNKAKLYDFSNDEREAMLANYAAMAEAGDASVLNAEVYLLPERLYPIYLDDLSTDTFDWKNAAVAKWYGLSSVTAVEKYPETEQ